MLDRQNGSAKVEAVSVSKRKGSRRHNRRAAFIAKAREHGCDGSATDFEKAFMKVVQPFILPTLSRRKRRQESV